MIYPSAVWNFHRLSLYSLLGSSIECTLLCLRIAFTFVQSLNSFVGIIWLFIIWDSFMSCPLASAIVMLMIHADNYLAEIISQMVNNNMTLV